jgi:hypothetical protein
VLAAEEISMKWIERFGEPHLVMTDDDLAHAQPLIIKAAGLWARDYRDTGAVVIGSGVAVLYLPPRCRNPVDRVIIEPPGQGDGSDSVNTPLKFLNRHGVPCFWECGRRD